MKQRVNFLSEPQELTYVDKNRTIQLVLLGTLTITAIIGYIFRPEAVSMLYNYFCFTLFLISTFLFFLLKKKANYFDFETIFIIFLAVIGFAYSVFFYNENDPYSIAFSLSFDTNFIPKGTMLFVLGIQAFFWGSIMAKRSTKQPTDVVTKSKIPIDNTPLTIIVILLGIAFLLSGGVSYYRSVYYFNNSDTSTGLIFQISSLLHAFSITAIATEFYNKLVNKDARINPLLMIVLMIVITLMLYAGNRTLASQLALPAIGLYTLFYKDIRFMKFLIFVLIAIGFMWFIQITRVGGSISTVEDGTKLISDLTIPTRSTYSCMEYIQEYGQTWGKNLLGGLIGVVPFLERILVTTLNLDSRTLGSAEILTDYTLGPNPYVGLGTNIIADLFLSFNVYGVIFFMFCLGAFVSHYQAKAKEVDYYSIIIYSSLLSFSVYLVRTTYTHPIKLIIWCLIIGLVNKSISQKQLQKSE